MHRPSGRRAMPGCNQIARSNVKKSPQHHRRAFSEFPALLAAPRPRAHEAQCTTVGRDCVMRLVPAPDRKGSRAYGARVRSSHRREGGAESGVLNLSHSHTIGCIIVAMPCVAVRERWKGKAKRRCTEHANTTTYEGREKKARCTYLHGGRCR